MLKIKHTAAWTVLSLLIMLVFTGCASIEKAEGLYRQGEKQEALEMAISLLEDDNVKDATKETDRDLIEESEEETNEGEEKDEDDMRLEMALASSTNALTIANELTQGSVVRAMNTATNITDYYVADISGGAYNDATPLEGGTIVDNKKVFKNLTQDKLHNQMVEEQYK